MLTSLKRMRPTLFRTFVTIKIHTCPANDNIQLFINNFVIHHNTYSLRNTLLIPTINIGNNLFTSNMSQTSSQPNLDCTGDDCKIVSREISRMFLCKGTCKRYYHHRCLGIGLKRAQKGIFCRDCLSQHQSNSLRNEDTQPLTQRDTNSDTDTITASPLRTNLQENLPDQPVPSTSSAAASSQQDNSSSTNSENIEYEVQRILKHRKQRRNPTLEYLILWKDFPEEEATWEPESALTKCWTKVFNYKRAWKLGLPTFEKPNNTIGAAYDPSRTNPANWIEPSRLMSAISTYRDNKRPKALPSILILPTEDVDSKIIPDTAIYIFILDSHAYVGLNVPEHNCAYLADGQNILPQELDCQTTIKSILRCPIKIVKFIGQTSVDYCASSAVVIALELERLYINNENIPSTLRPTKSLINLISRRFHKHSSLKINPTANIQTNYVKLACPNSPLCTYSTAPKNRGGYYAHVRLCKLNS